MGGQPCEEVNPVGGGGKPVGGGGVLHDERYMTPLGRFDLQSHSA